MIFPSSIVIMRPARRASAVSCVTMTIACPLEPSSSKISATRLAADRFYCAAHYLRKQPQAAGAPRVFWCAVATGG